MDILTQFKIKLAFNKFLHNRKKIKKYQEKIDRYYEQIEQKKQTELKRKEYYQHCVTVLDDLKKSRTGKQYDMTCFVVCYNHIDTIQKALDSILSQQTKYKFLIKILDDASTDGTIDILMDYAQRFPDKIELVLQENNSRGMHISAAFSCIKTPYFCFLDGDDYWCDDSKIETAVSFLEAHPEYSMWGHDTLFKNAFRGTEVSYLHDKLKIHSLNDENPVLSFEHYTYIHMSARVYRNIIDFDREYLLNRKRDFFIYFAFLDKGPLFFCDKIMSVYNYDGKGVFSSLSDTQSRYSNLYMYYTMNKYLGYRHDDFFTVIVNSELLKKLKTFFGRRIGWKLYITNTKRKLYNKELSYLKNKYNKIEAGHEPFPSQNYLTFYTKYKETFGND